MKIIARVFAGFGNQMFQYACGKAVASRLKADLYLDLSWFYNGNRIFALDIFPNINYYELPQRNSFINKIIRHPFVNKIIRHPFINKIIALGINILCRMKYVIIEPYHAYWEGIEQIKSSVVLYGFWQNEKYFSFISSVIKHDFQFPEFDSFEAKNMAGKITKTPFSICVHVRRGDYIEDPRINKFHGVCSPDYYKEAINIIIDKSEEKMNPELYLFSDDPDWVKNNFNTCGLPSFVVDIEDHKKKPYHDMHLMSLCQHHIIANSSFSWWGAWLSSKNGIVVAPKRWFADEKMKSYNPSVESWITI